MRAKTLEQKNNESASWSVLSPNPFLPSNRKKNIPRFGTRLIQQAHEKRNVK